MIAMPSDQKPRKTPVNLWRAALYGALFMMVVRAINSIASGEPYFASNFAEFLCILVPGILLFVDVGYLNNRRLARRESAASLTKN